MKNYLSNMFTIINNGQLAKRNFVIFKKKKICKNFLDILWNENLILGYKNESQSTKLNKNNNNFIKIFLKYTNGKPVINNIKQITKPGYRLYYTTKQIWKINSKNALLIFSTNKGLKTLDQCKKLKIGGELYIILN